MNKQQFKFISRLYHAFFTLFGHHPIEYGKGEVWDSKMNEKD